MSSMCFRDFAILSSKADPAPPPPPRLEFFMGVFLETRINFIGINMQCLQYVFYSLKHTI